MSLDLTARYAVDGYPGIAFYLRGYATTQLECQGHPVEDAADLFPHAGIGETFYCDGTCEEPTGDRDRVRAVMVGDDREHLIDVDDLTPLDELGYCAECGQIGCEHDGRDRE